MSRKKPSVLVCGIGGASLGTEILKCLRLAGRYRVFGCDISEYAYGHFDQGVHKTFVVSRREYVDSVREICRLHQIAAVIPGGEEPLHLLGARAEEFEQIGVHLAANSPEVIRVASDKRRLFEHLGHLGISAPRTEAVRDVERIPDIPFPWVVKPATGSGGSRLVFLVSTKEEAQLYLKYLLENTETVLVQEYLPLDEGEFTVGVLSLPDGGVAGSVALRRLFHTKLSVSSLTRSGLISSGYSQGLIDDFPGLRRQAEQMAAVLGSAGPLNIQARVRNGVLLPFEINPRFSASTYLRALAGFNEVDIYLQWALFHRSPRPNRLQPGYYLRSLTETFVPKEALCDDPLGKRMPRNGCVRSG